MLQNLPEWEFTCSRRRRCSIYEQIPWRTEFIVKVRSTIQRYAVGFCVGEKLHCRPKSNCTAVMFWQNEEYSWCHLTNEEFDVIFGEKA